MQTYLTLNTNQLSLGKQKTPTLQKRKKRKFASGNYESSEQIDINFIPKRLESKNLNISFHILLLINLVDNDQKFT